MKISREAILPHALQNAVLYCGKADAGAVIGKVLASDPGLRKDIASLRKEVAAVVAEVNRMAPDAQKAMFAKLSPKMLEREVKRQDELPDIPGAVQGGFVTRFAPSPTGPLNLGHLLRPVMLPYLYSRKYGGTFILRLEDTDAKKVKKEYYEMIKEDLIAAGVKWDKLVLESDGLESYYRHAEEMLRKGAAYVCTCDAKAFMALKDEKKDCPCRPSAAKDNLAKWRGMLAGRFGEGDAVVRLKTSMQDPNPTMRDPPLLRISETPHPLRGADFRVWPLYNFACAIEDHSLGVTHVFRGKEHEHNTSIQERIYRFFGWKPPATVNFGMVYLPGTKLHTRDMAEMIGRGEASGWDDPKLPTLRALFRRGFQPAAIAKFAAVCSISKTDIRVGWENLEGINRKLIDPMANRYMAVIDPVRVSVNGAPAIAEAREDLHPDFPDRGRKRISVSLGEIYLSLQDWDALRGKPIRLKGLGNIILDKESPYKGNELVQGMPKVQWVSVPHVGLEILAPSGTLKGIAEAALGGLEPGTLIQLERIGFGRVDAVSEKKVTVCFAHK